MRIIIDSREQNPFLFSGYDCTSEIGTLYSGDYSVSVLESSVAVERKSINDLTGCITSGRERFVRELERLRGYDSCAVVVESPWSDFVSGKYRSRLNPSAAEQSIISIMQKYRIPFFFAANRDEAEKFTFNFLRHAYRHAIEKYSGLTEAR